MLVFQRPPITLSARSGGSKGSSLIGYAMVTSWWVRHQRVGRSPLRPTHPNPHTRKGAITMLGLNLTNKRALVTGSSSGIGESIARALAREGAAVVVHGRDRERAQRVADQIHAQGGKASLALGDLVRKEDTQRVESSTTEARGGIH